MMKECIKFQPTKSSGIKSSGINRVESETFKGWSVRGYAKDGFFVQLFSDSPCGDSFRAFEAARSYQEDIYRSQTKVGFGATIMGV